jgi:HAD superfamily hydrolase (TIGR01509 family)
MTIITTVLLDLDGTLVDSNDQHARAWVEALGDFGHVVDFERARAAIGKGADNFLPDVVGLEKESPEGVRIAERSSALFKARYLPGLRPFPNARALLERLHDAGLHLVTATSANEDEMRALLEIVGVTHLMYDAATAADAKRSKPDPDILGAALRKAGAEPRRALMLGDTPYDVSAALKVHVGAVAVRCGGWREDAFEGALAVYDDPADILANYESSPFGAMRRGSGEH